MKLLFVAEITLCLSIGFSSNLFAENHGSGSETTTPGSGTQREEAPKATTMKDKTAEILSKNTGYPTDSVKFNWDTKVPEAFEKAKEKDVAKREEKNWGEVIGVALTVKPTEMWKTELDSVKAQKDSACVEGGEAEACDAAKRFLWGAKFVVNKNDETLKTEEIQKFLKEMEPFLKAQNKTNEDRNKNIENALTGNADALKKIQTDPALAGLGKFADLMLKAGNKAGTEIAAKFLAAASKEKDGQRVANFFNPKGELKQQKMGPTGNAAQNVSNAQKFLEENKANVGNWIFTNQEPQAAPAPSPTAQPQGGQQQQQQGGTPPAAGNGPSKAQVEQLVSANCTTCHRATVAGDNISNFTINGKRLSTVLGFFDTAEGMKGLKGSAVYNQLSTWAQQQR